MDDELLGVMQMSDSMFPAGTFAMSNGLESMYLAGDVATREGLEALLRSQMSHQVGPSDCAAAALAHRRSREGDLGGLLRLDAEYAASRSVREARDASARSGAQMVRCIREMLDDRMVNAYAEKVLDGGAAGAYPVSFGVCCRAMGVSEYGTALAVAYGFAAVCVGAALRLGMIQHIEAQGIIHSVKPDMERAARAGCAADTMWQFCPQAEILQMSHEGQDSKMFIT